MKVYRHRQDDEYLKTLGERLSFDGPNGLIKNSVVINNPLVFEGREYERCCRVDFSGIAATTLFDTSGSFSNGNLAKRMREIFRKAHVFNEQGIFVKLRLLLVYPYSAYSLSRIQAEFTKNRSTIDEPVYPRNLDVVESVDERAFLQSNFVISQTQMLDQLQEWVDEAGWSRKTLNRAMVRFVPTSPNFCLLVLNDTAFLDPYLLAKKNRYSNQCVQLGPLVEMNREKDAESFAAIDDHFRYLWDLDLSIYCQDATSYIQDKPCTLSRVKPPTKVTFDSKASIIKEKKPDLSDEAIVGWKSRTRRILNRFSVEPAPSPGSETLFITCSWNEEAGQSLPHDYAREVSRMLEDDFGRGLKEPMLSVFIMEAATSDFFTQQLYARLDESTMGLVLLTADIEGKDGKVYSRPNVYHELGYLMKQLGGKKVAIVSEDQVTVPSNITDVMRIDFRTRKLILVYAKVAGWVIQLASYGEKVISKVERNIIDRLNAQLNDGLISQEECVKAKESVRNYLL